jgi:hypothetical protein
MSNKPNRPPLTLRDALVILLSLLVGVAGGYLFYLGTHSVPLAILTGGAAFAAAWRFFNAFIE